MVTTKKLFKYYENEGNQDHCQRVMYADGAHINLRGIITGLLSQSVRQDSICLDAGCAEGWYCKLLSLKADFVVGVDISIPKLRRAIAEQNSTNVSYVMGSWDCLPFRDEFFSIVTFIEGPEHCLKPERTLDELHRVAKKQGLIFVSAPIEKPSTEKDPLIEPFEGHLSFFSPSSLMKLVEKGFHITQTRFPSSSESVVHRMKHATSKTGAARIIRRFDHILLHDSILSRSPVPHGIIVGKKKAE